MVPSNYSTTTETQALLAEGKITVEQIIKDHQTRYEERDGQVRAWVCVGHEKANREIPKGPLTGVVVGVKDNIIGDVTLTGRHQGSPDRVWVYRLQLTLRHPITQPHSFDTPSLNGPIFDTPSLSRHHFTRHSTLHPPYIVHYITRSCPPSTSPPLTIVVSSPARVRTCWRPRHPDRDRLDGDGSRAAKAIVAHPGNAFPRKEYVRVLDELAALRPKFDAIARRYDAVISPATLVEAPSMGEHDVEEFCSLWSGLHTPTIVVPGFVGPNGLPIGLTLIASRYDDERLLQTAKLVAEVFIGADDGLKRVPAPEGAVHLKP